jgi:hypothetical protein
MTMAQHPQHPWKAEHHGGRPVDRPRTATSPAPAPAASSAAASPAPAPALAPAAAAAEAAARARRFTAAASHQGNGRNGSLLGRLAGGAAAIAVGAAKVRSSLQRRRREAPAMPPMPRRPWIRRQECTDLLSFLRAAVDKPVPTIVIAGAAGGEGTTRVVDGIAEAARDAGVRLFAAELGGSPGRPLLQQRRVIALPQPVRGSASSDRRLTAGASAGSADEAGPRAAAAPAKSAGLGSAADRSSSKAPSPRVPDLTPSASAAMTGGDGDGGDSVASGRRDPEASAGAAGALAKARESEGSGGLSRWSEHTGGSVDFILVEAPSLDRTADAALLARACDGLVLVVESEVTPRESLRRAVRVAEVSGCRVLGMVMNEARPPLPGWLQRFLSGTSRTR